MTSWAPPPVSTPSSPMVQGVEPFYDWSPPATSRRPVGQGSSVSPNWAIGAVVAGQLAGAYAAFSQARLATYEARGQASAWGFRARMLELDRRAAEVRAQSILDQGQSEAGVIGLEGAQRRAITAASDAANGVTAGVGSAAEVAASDRLMQAIDVYHVNLGAVRAANAVRTGAVGAGNEALLARTSGAILRRSARAAAPEASLVSGIAQGALSGYALSRYRSA